jgi:hypothetical protein
VSTDDVSTDEASTDETAAAVKPADGKAAKSCCAGKSA